jgi:hypothetical protein
VRFLVITVAILAKKKNYIVVKHVENYFVVCVLTMNVFYVQDVRRLKQMNNSEEKKKKEESPEYKEFKEAYKLIFEVEKRQLRERKK